MVDTADSGGAAQHLCARGEHAIVQGELPDPSCVCYCLGDNIKLLSTTISKVNDCANSTNPANFQTCLKIIKIKTTIKLVLLKGMLDSAAR